MPVDPVRDAAIDTLLRVFEKGTNTNHALERTISRKGSRLSSRGRRFLTHLVYGTTRYVNLADYILRDLLNQPIKKLPFPILLVLRMGVYQTLFLDTVTFPSMVHTSVDLAKKKGHAGTARLVNAVLKRIPKTLEEVTLPDKNEDMAFYLSIRYSLENWLCSRWVEEYGPHKAEALCAACNEEAPASIRVNTTLTTREDLLAQLEKLDLKGEADPLIPDAISLIKSAPPVRNKIFKEGHFYIQDAASMLPPHLLEPEPGERILDMCASPGGKTTHIAELTQNGALIISNDLGGRNYWRTQENIDRLQLAGIHLTISDANALPLKGPFDRVLLDAPCTGMGTFRRHPELKYRMGPKAPRRLAKKQLTLLRSAIEVCKNGGVIVYSVCTFSAEETEDLAEIITGEAAVELEDGPAWLDAWKINKGQYKILPGNGPLDGFYLMRLRKQS
ncbi:MAG: 16S rRNA (cytosine(967)-C(5))-methyltransferase RsmB [Candidatus Hydrogenedentota bacterium]